MKSKLFVILLLTVGLVFSVVGAASASALWYSVAVVMPPD